MKKAGLIPAFFMSVFLGWHSPPLPLADPVRHSRAAIQTRISL